MPRHLTVVAVSKPVSAAPVHAGAAVLGDDPGWAVTVDETVGAGPHSWGGAGTPAARAAALRGALTGGSDAVFCAAGGDHAVEILDHIDFTEIAAGPHGAFVGTSDNTIVAAVAAEAGVTAFCGPDLASDARGTREAQLGRSRPFDFASTRTAIRTMFHPGHRQLAPPQMLAGWVGPIADRGAASGQLVAVNLPSLLRLAGTRWWPSRLLDGAVLLIERDATSADAVVADIVQLSQLGVLDRVAGLGIGWLENLDMAAFGQIAVAAADLCPAPVWKIGVFGHRCPHLLLPYGAHCTVTAAGETWATWPCLPAR